MRRSAAALALVAATLWFSEPAPAGAADGQYTVRLAAVAHKGGAPLAAPMIVKIWARSGARTGGKVAELSALPAKLALTPGEYRVLVVHETVRRVQDIEVGLGGRTTLDLAAGEVELLLRGRPGAAALTGPVVWSVHQYKRGQDVGAHIVDVTGAPASVRLTAGYYDIVAAHGGQRVNHVIEVIPGQTTDYTLLKR